MEFKASRPFIYDSLNFKSETAAVLNVFLFLFLLYIYATMPVWKLDYRMYGIIALT